MMNENNLTQMNEDLKKNSIEKDQYYFGHGKLLVTGEYFVLDGAQALALPTKLGQSLSVSYTPSFSPILNWKSYDIHGNCWFDYNYEFWHFKCLSENPTEEALFIQKILQQVRKQNPHFLRDEVEVKVESRLGFPITWGLGTSSSLIYNIAQWAYVSPFELLFKTHGGSGYDIACAQSEGPIIYKKTGLGPNWSPVYFNPEFRDNLYFVYLGNKKNSREAIKEYNQKKICDPKAIAKISELTQDFLSAKTLVEIQQLINFHESYVANILDLTPVKELRFKDFNGSIKSLGAWGGDFVLVASSEKYDSVKKYFNQHGLNIVMNYNDLIAPPVDIENFDTVKMSASHLIH